MTYQGTVQNGVIVFEPGVQLPEGSPVRVEVVGESVVKQDLTNDEDYDALLNMSDLAVDMGVPDLSVNLDHYLYGHPKVTYEK